MKIFDKNFTRVNSLKLLYFNTKRKMIKWFLNTFIAKNDEYYDYDLPSDENMKDKTFWIQIIDNKSEDFVEEIDFEKEEE